MSSTTRRISRGTLAVATVLLLTLSGLPSLAGGPVSEPVPDGGACPTVTGTQVWSGDTTIDCEIIVDGGSLTLRDGTFTVLNTEIDAYFLNVINGGSLTILNAILRADPDQVGANIQSSWFFDPSYPVEYPAVYYIRVMSGSTMTIDRSTISANALFRVWTGATLIVRDSTLQADPAATGGVDFVPVGPSMDFKDSTILIENTSWSGQPPFAGLRTLYTAPWTPIGPGFTFQDYQIINCTFTVIESTFDVNSEPLGLIDTNMVPYGFLFLDPDYGTVTGFDNDPNHRSRKFNFTGGDVRFYGVTTQPSSQNATDNPIQTIESRVLAPVDGSTATPNPGIALDASDDFSHAIGPLGDILDLTFDLTGILAYDRVRLGVEASSSGPASWARIHADTGSGYVFMGSHAGTASDTFSNISIWNVASFTELDTLKVRIENPDSVEWYFFDHVWLEVDTPDGLVFRLLDVGLKDASGAGVPDTPVDLGVRSMTLDARHTPLVDAAIDPTWSPDALAYLDRTKGTTYNWSRPGLESDASGHAYAYILSDAIYASLDNSIALGNFNATALFLNDSTWYNQSESATTPVIPALGADSAWVNLTIQSSAFVALGFDIPVAQGWNLISTPLDDSGDLVAYLDDSAGDGATLWDGAWWYDAADSSDPWKSYFAARPAYLDDSLTMDKTRGVWIRVTQLGDAKISLAGSPAIASTIALDPGWNLVGYPHRDVTRTVGDLFASVSHQGVVGMDGAQDYLVTDLTPEVLMAPGSGYWVFATQAEVWNVPG